jgi:hypothetical protein
LPLSVVEVALEIFEPKELVDRSSVDRDFNNTLIRGADIERTVSSEIASRREWDTAAGYQKFTKTDMIDVRAHFATSRVDEADKLGGRRKPTRPEPALQLVLNNGAITRNRWSGSDAIGARSSVRASSSVAVTASNHSFHGDVRSSG